MELSSPKIKKFLIFQRGNFPSLKKKEKKKNHFEKLSYIF